MPVRLKEAEKDTIARAWIGASDRWEAFHNWLQILIVASKKKRYCHTKKECVAILAQQGIATTVSAINNLSYSGRISRVIKPRFHAGMIRHIALFNPREIAKYYEGKEDDGRRTKAPKHL